MLGYCQAKVGGKQYGREMVGGHRCTLLAVVTVGWKVLCKQHAKRERSRADVRV